MTDKWVEILKAGGWKTAATSAVSGVFLFAIWMDWIQNSENIVWIYDAVGVLALSACLTIASIFQAFLDLLRPIGMLLRSHKRRIMRKELIEEIQYFRDQEKDFAVYLLNHNQQMFLTDIDEDHTRDVIARESFNFL